MAGRGGVENGRWKGVVPPESWPNPRILRLNARLRWELAHEPLHADIDIGKVCGVGPGMVFANEIIRARVFYDDAVIGLVPSAVGGTRISGWARGTRLYGELVGRAWASVRDGGGMIRAVIWYQGESDTVKKEDAEAYKENLEKFIRDVRSDLNNPNLPFIVVALASGEGKFTDIVRRGQLAIDLPNIAVVDANGLPLKTEGLHLTARSEFRLGLKLVDGYLAIQAVYDTDEEGN